MPEKTKSTRRMRPKANPPPPTPAATSGPPSPPDRQPATTQSTVMDLREILECLTLVKRTPAGAVDPSSELCQHVKMTPKGAETSMPDKRACMELAAKLQGFLHDKTKPTPAGRVDAPFTLSEERRQLLIEKKRAAALQRMEAAG